MIVYTPSDTNETNAQEFDDGDAPSAGNLNPLGEAAFNTAKWAANRVGAFRLIQIEDSYATSSGTVIGGTSSGTYGTGDVLLSTVDVDEGDVVEISVDIHAGCTPEKNCGFRLVYTLAGGGVTPIAGAEANRTDPIHLITPIHLQGCVHIGSLPGGTLNIYLQMKVADSATLAVMGPVSPIVKVWRFNA